MLNAGEGDRFRSGRSAYPLEWHGSLFSGVEGCPGRVAEPLSVLQQPNGLPRVGEARQGPEHGPSCAIGASARSGALGGIMKW